MYRATSLTMVFVGLATIPAGAGTIRVPGDQPTIQDAINVAVNGDVVQVDPGTWVENLDFLGKTITVQSVSGAAVTTIDGGGAGSVVTFQSAEPAGAVLEGFTITNGTGTLVGSDTEGGGVRIVGASPTLRDNVIELNEAAHGGGVSLSGGSMARIESNLIQGNGTPSDTTGDGGGLHVLDSSPTILDNEIRENRLRSYAQNGNGGGIYVGGTSDPWIQGNWIVKNFVVYGSGSGIALDVGSDATILDNRIEANSGSRGYPTTVLDGGGIAIRQSSPLIARNLFLDNLANGEQTTAAGGGLLVSGGAPRIVSNLFIGNVAVGDYGTGLGGGLYIGSGASPVVIGCTFWDNTGWEAGGGMLVQTGSGPVQVESCIFWDNLAGSGAQIHDPASLVVVSWSDVQGGWPGTGNIDADPRFVNVGTFDMRLKADSPCLDTGSPVVTFPAGEQRDCLGNSRLLDGDLDGVRRLDRGACESTNVRLELTGKVAGGATVTLHTLSAVLGDSYLIAGVIAPTGYLLPQGYLFVQPSGWLFAPWIPGTSHVDVTIPVVPAPVEVVVQMLLQTPTAGNLSNPLVLDIE